ncbi:CoB--CoM heterodisulfide reductase iron-sulfur subunit B family protein [Pseudodesulfovibrio tunisiensis]|uniref:CoB--CoM heterodisulfide reductase iron-sulfur subunit B family protein n=1 Tax=Pseudodesulfovibrio tunisiensis TaxID=463192 RepID=UPI001FB54FCC|nr:CoB--CoM heterodisulfide reductase iron-sulfur subunit B family protein [Pseudodesulfovibrio tunisiensis]
MKYAYFPGCKVAHHLPQYGLSVESVCRALDIELVHIEFNCCGWPVRHESFEASIYSAARNLALAEDAGLSILTPCKCCFGSLKHAVSRLAHGGRLAGGTAELLDRDGLSLPDRPEVFHLLTVLAKHVGIDTLRGRVSRPLAGLAVACHYGCHALRPGDVTGFDDPLAPTIFERVVAALGAEPVNWDLRLECCGHPLRGRDDVISEALMRRKLEDAQTAGAQIVATACTYCQMQFDTERDRLDWRDPLRSAPPAVLISQLVGLALGLDSDCLGLGKNRIPFDFSGF